MSFPLAAETGGHAPMGTWNSKGVIVFGPASDGNLYQVGVNENRTPSLVSTGGEGFRRRPSFLPDGQHFIYFTAASGVEIRVASLTTADSAPIGTFESSGVYAGGHLFFMRGGNLMMQALSEETLKLEGEPVSLGVQVRRDNVLGARFSVSRTAGLRSCRRQVRRQS